MGSARGIGCFVRWSRIGEVGVRLRRVLGVGFVVDETDCGGLGLDRW